MIKQLINIILFRLPALFLFVIYLIISKNAKAQASSNPEFISKDGILIFRLEDSTTLAIRIISNSICNVILFPGDSIYRPFSLIVEPEIPEFNDYELQKTGNKVKISTSGFSLLLDPRYGDIDFVNKQGRVLLKRNRDNYQSLVPLPDSLPNLYSLMQTFNISEDESIYGLGQHLTGFLNYRGKKTILSQANKTKAIPFMLSSEGYGLLWDNYSSTIFEEKNNVMSFSSEAGECINYYVIIDDKADSLIAGYRYLTGRVPMYGKWAYGYWQSKERYKNREDLMSVAREYRKRNIPIDNIVQDWRYWGNLGWNAMDFDTTVFPDATGMIDSLHQMNFKLMVSVWPVVGFGTPVYEELTTGKLLYPNGHWAKGLIYDAYSPEARSIYWKWMNNGLFSKNVDAWWLDGTEPEFQSTETQDSTRIEILKNKNNALGPFYQYLNPYSLMSCKGVYEGQRNVTDEKRVYILTRCAFAGQQKYGATTWSGDIKATWEVFQQQIPAGLNFCMSGIPYWATDIGAFFVKPREKYPEFSGDFPGGCENPGYRELYTRWFQYGAFCPIFRSHGTDTPREIWNFGNPGESYYDALVLFDKLRYRLMPYIYSLAYKTTFSGYTIMRGLVFDFKHDMNALKTNNQFMFGPYIMVAPVIKPGIESMDVYLPECNGWYDFWSGEVFDGGKMITATTPIDKMPLLIRKGAILIFGPDIQYASQKSEEPLEVRIYSGDNGEFILYEDENDNYNYEKGMYSTISFSWDDNEQILTIGKRNGSFPGMSEEKIFNIVVINKNNKTGGVKPLTPDRTVAYNGSEIKLLIK